MNQSVIPASPGEIHSSSPRDGEQRCASSLGLRGRRSFSLALEVEGRGEGGCHPQQPGRVYAHTFRAASSESGVSTDSNLRRIRQESL